MAQDEHLDKVIDHIAGKVLNTLRAQIHTLVREQIRRCSQCGDLFVIRTRRQNYCSDRCSVNGRQAKWVQTHPAEHAKRQAATYARRRRK